MGLGLASNTRECIIELTKGKQAGANKMKDLCLGSGRVEGFNPLTSDVELEKIGAYILDAGNNEPG